MKLYMCIKLLPSLGDAAYYASWLAFWSYPETMFGFLVLCLPVFPKLFRPLLKRMSWVHDKGPPQSHEAQANGNRRPPRSWWHTSEGTNNSGGGSSISSNVES